MKLFADLLLNKNNTQSNDQVPFIQRRRGIEIKSSREINLMKKSSRIVATVLREINDLIKPGMSTQDLDDFAEKRIREMGAYLCDSKFSWPYLDANNRLSNGFKKNLITQKGY